MVLGGKESPTAPSDAMVVVCITNSNLYQNGAYRRNTLQAPRNDSIVPITEYVGFRFAYLRQLWTRMCRASVPAEEEAATIMMVHPSAVIGNDEYNYWGISRKIRDVKGFAQTLIRAVFVLSQAGQKGVQFRRVRPRDR